MKNIEGISRSTSRTMKINIFNPVTEPIYWFSKKEVKKTYLKIKYQATKKIIVTTIFFNSIRKSLSLSPIL